MNNVDFLLNDETNITIEDYNERLNIYKRLAGKE